MSMMKEKTKKYEQTNILDVDSSSNEKEHVHFYIINMIIQGKKKFYDQLQMI
jgi:hypothetical protein